MIVALVKDLVNSLDAPFDARCFLMQTQDWNQIANAIPS